MPTPFIWEGEGGQDGLARLISYWDMRKAQIPVGTLLEEIIKADIEGFQGLCSSVCFMSTADVLMFHLYDDRGADLVAADRETLRPAFERFNHWILDYDREAINRAFVENPEETGNSS